MYDTFTHHSKLLPNRSHFHTYLYICIYTETLRLKYTNRARVTQITSCLLFPNCIIHLNFIYQKRTMIQKAKQRYEIWYKQQHGNDIGIREYDDHHDTGGKLKAEKSFHVSRLSMFVVSAMLRHNCIVFHWFLFKRHVLRYTVAFIFGFDVVGKCEAFVYFVGGCKCNIRIKKKISWHESRIIKWMKRCVNRSRYSGVGWTGFKIWKNVDEILKSVGKLLS